MSRRQPGFLSPCTIPRPVISTDDEEASARGGVERSRGCVRCVADSGNSTRMPFPGTALLECRPKLVWGLSSRHIKFSSYTLERACAARVERLVSAWQRTYSRDLSTPPPSPALRDPSESVEMTARAG